VLSYSVYLLELTDTFYKSYREINVDIIQSKLSFCVLALSFKLYISN